MKYMRYRIISRKEIALLEQNVNMFLNNGWQLAGGVTYDGENYLQAIVFVKRKLSFDEKLKENILSNFN